MTDLEIVPMPEGSLAEYVGVEPPRPKRRTYNYRRIEALTEALADTQRQLVETHDALQEANATIAELSHAATNRATLEAALTGEHPVAVASATDGAFAAAWFATPAGVIGVAIAAGGFIGFILGAGVPK